jgi:hypothetical protein
MNELAAISQVTVGPQVECPVTDHFAPGVYCREVFMPAGAFVVGHVHKTAHLNILLSGKLRVYMSGAIHELSAPFVFRSGVGVQKIGFILEDCTWLTVHPTDKTDVEEIYREIIDAEAVGVLGGQAMKALTEGIK